MNNFSQYDVSQPFHFCRYSAIKKTIRDHANGQRWTEKCWKCGKFKAVDCTFIVDGSNSPRITVTWFDEEGKYLKTTGYVPDIPS